MGANKSAGGGQVAYNYVYDRYGNRWQQNGPNTFIATFIGNNPGNPANNNRMDGYSYDAAGNLLNDGVHSYTYDAENRVIKVDNGNTASYVYGPDGNRAQRTSAVGDSSDPSGTYTLGYDRSGHLKWRLDASGGVVLHIEIYAGSRHLATQDGGTNFSHSDWLGTERVRTRFNSTYWSVCESIASLPFGDGQTTTFYPANGFPYGCYHTSPLHFTGKERDPETGLDNFGARFDASNLGRFMSPDDPQADQDPSGPQSWNLYTYVRNNPIDNIDPTGNACVSTDGGKTFHDDKSGGQSCADAANPMRARLTLTILEPFAVPIAATGPTRVPSSDLLHNVAEFFGRTPSPGCLLGWTAAGAATGARFGLGAGPVIQGALAVPTFGGSEALGGPPGGAALGALGFGFAGGVGGNLVGQVACRTGQGGGGGAGGGGQAPRVNGREGEFWRGLKNWRNGIKTNGLSGKARRLFEFDDTHQELEVYDRYGNHLGTADPHTGEMTGSAVKGRTIDIR